MASYYGREPRLHYWGFCIANIVLSFICVLIHPFLLVVYLFLTVYPSITMMVKRAHDFNYSGYFIWLCLIPILGLIPSLMLLFKAGTKGANRYGEEPVLFASQSSSHNGQQSTVTSHTTNNPKPDNPQDTASHLNNQQLDQLFDENK